MTMVTRRNYSELFLLWMCSLSMGWGIFLYSGATLMLFPFFIASYTTVIISLLTSIRLWHDCFNPLALVIVFWMIRFSIAGCMTLFGIEPDAAIFEIMRLGLDDWIWGHTLAMLGMLGVVLGWSLSVKWPRLITREVAANFHIRLRSPVCLAAGAAMIIGFTSLMLFIKSNASVVEATVTGSFRSTEIKPGTGKYFHLGLMLSAGSVVFTAYLLRSRRFQWAAILPVLVATGSFWILGGRMRALTPLLAYLLLLFYKRGLVRLSVKNFLLFTLLALVLLLLLIVGQFYRGNVPLSEFVRLDSAGALHLPLYSILITDLGQLYSLAGATAIGPGVLGGRTFLAMLWPWSNLLNLGGKSAGIYIVETLVGFAEEEGSSGQRTRWGVHALLIGDAYLNFGLLGVILLTIAFGMILKAVYVRFREGIVPDVLFVLFVIYSIVYIFYGSIEKFGETLIIFAFAIFVIKLGEALRIALRRV